MGFLSFLAGLGSVLGALVLVLGFVSAKGAPQEAAVAALAVALAVLPYVFMRAFQVSASMREQREHRRDVLRRLESLETAMDRRNGSTTP